MSKYVKIGFFVFAFTLMFGPAVSEAQLNTRRGTIAGAVIGGIIGDQNNEALAGVAIGGIVGNVVGRAVDRNSFGGGGFSSNLLINNLFTDSPRRSTVSPRRSISNQSTVSRCLYTGNLSINNRPTVVVIVADAAVTSCRPTIEKTIEAFF